MEEGIKYDKDKPRLYDMGTDFNEALAEVAKVWAFGAQKYGKYNWRKVTEGYARYSNALLRHLLEGATHDDETHLLHAAHTAWNALARLQLLLEDMHKQEVSDDI